MGEAGLPLGANVRWGEGGEGTRGLEIGRQGAPQLGRDQGETQVCTGGGGLPGPAAQVSGGGGAEGAFPHLEQGFGGLHQTLGVAHLPPAWKG